MHLSFVFIAWNTMQVFGYKFSLVIYDIWLFLKNMSLVQEKREALSEETYVPPPPQWVKARRSSVLVFES